MKHNFCLSTKNLPSTDSIPLEASSIYELQSSKQNFKHSENEAQNLIQIITVFAYAK
jgi:hypothetical protein